MQSSSGTVFDRALKGRQWLWAVGLIVLYLAQILLAVRHQSQTNDEGYHLAAGYRYWQCGDFGINPEHPPLVKLVAAAPLFVTHTAPPQGFCGQETTDKYAGYGRSSHWYYEEGNDPERMMMMGRTAVAVFSLVLAITCFLFANRLFGSTAALLSLVLLAFEPNLLAHGALITTDTAITALMLASVFCFYRYAEKRTATRLLLTGLVTGLALAAKHSGVLVLPILLVLCLYEAWHATRQQTAGGKAWVNHLAALGVIVLVAIGVLWTFYVWRYAARPHGAAMAVPLFDFIGMAQEANNTSFILARVIPVLAPAHLLPESYLYGFVDVLSISDPGQPPFLLGKLYPQGVWFYFPINFIIKSTLGFLGLFALAILVVPWRKLDRVRQLIYLAVPCVIVLGAGMTSGLNIGYRHVLPIVPFLCILLGATASWLLSRSKVWQVVTIGLLALHVGSSVRAFPNYIPYSNEAWGGPSKTYLYLTDANADWGQGMKQVKQYLDKHHITDCWFAYDGVTSREYYGVHCRTLPPNRWSDGGPVPTTITGTLLISAMTISGIEWENDALNPYREFLHRKPDAVIAGTVLVYNGTFDTHEIAAVQQIAIANRLVGEHDYSGAVRAAQQAVSLSPHSVRAYLALGEALAGSKRTDEARKALRRAVELGNAQPEWYPNEIAEGERELRKLNGT